MTELRTREKPQLPKVAIDLFAGGGGLTLGLRSAGFCVAAAVENDAHAADTYRANHPGTVLFEQDIRKISGRELLKCSPTGRIDLVAGCPPCQGFSSLTSKYKRDDPRNGLVIEFERIISETSPSVFMLENVPGLARKGANLFSAMLERLEQKGYHIHHQVLDVAGYGVPQHRKRLVLIGSKMKPVKFPSQSHSNRKPLELPSFRHVKDALRCMRGVRPIELGEIPKGKSPQDYNWHVVRTLSAANKARLKAAKPGKSRTVIPMKLRPTCHQKDGNGFSNSYGRMSWKEPSPTITGGCTTLSKGRFGHPSRSTTISVREAALLQSFPLDYKFPSPFMDKTCQIIGNALPPTFAKVFASACLNLILEDEEL